MLGEAPGHASDESQWTTKSGLDIWRVVAECLVPHLTSTSDVAALTCTCRAAHAARSSPLAKSQWLLRQRPFDNLFVAAGSLTSCAQTIRLLLTDPSARQLLNHFVGCMTPLMASARILHTEAMEVLLGAGADANAQRASVITQRDDVHTHFPSPLSLALAHGWAGEPAPPSADDSFTALHEEAIAARQLQAVQLLLGHGAQLRVASQDTMGGTPTESATTPLAQAVTNLCSAKSPAARALHERTLHALLQQGEKQSQGQKQSRGTTGTPPQRLLLPAGQAGPPVASSSVAGAPGDTALAAAAAAAAPPLQELLLLPTGPRRRTPLHLACGGYAPGRVVAALLRHCPAAAARGEARGWLPLMECARQCHVEGVEALLTVPLPTAPLLAPMTRMQATAQSTADGASAASGASAVSGAGANANAPPAGAAAAESQGCQGQGQGAGAAAALHGQPAVRLLDAEQAALVCLNARRGELRNLTALHFAVLGLSFPPLHASSSAKAGRRSSAPSDADRDDGEEGVTGLPPMPTTRQLVHFGFGASAPARLGAPDATVQVSEAVRAALHARCREAASRCCALLLAAGADASLRDGRGLTPLLAAALLGCPATLRALLGCPAVRPQLNNSFEVHLGGSALHLAAAHNHVAAAKLLLAAGADPFLQGQGGVTPLQLAEGLGRAEAAELLTLAQMHVLRNRSRNQGETAFGAGDAAGEGGAGGNGLLMEGQGDGGARLRVGVVPWQEEAMREACAWAGARWPVLRRVPQEVWCALAALAAALYFAAVLRWSA